MATKREALAATGPKKARSPKAAAKKTALKKSVPKEPGKSALKKSPKKPAPEKPAPNKPASKKSAGIRTTVTGASVDAFIATVDSDSRRADAQALVKLFEQVSGWPPKMWGPAIIGFGAYHYTYESGHSGSICALGFSPRKANFAIYVADFPGKEALLAKLGKHKGGIRQCLYITRVVDVDTGVLSQILAGGLAQLKKVWPVTAA